MTKAKLAVTRWASPFSGILTTQAPTYISLLGITMGAKVAQHPYVGCLGMKNILTLEVGVFGDSPYGSLSRKILEHLLTQDGRPWDNKI